MNPSQRSPTGLRASYPNLSKLRSYKSIIYKPASGFKHKQALSPLRILLRPPLRPCSCLLDASQEHEKHSETRASDCRERQHVVAHGDEVVAGVVVAATQPTERAQRERVELEHEADGCERWRKEPHGQHREREYAQRCAQVRALVRALAGAHVELAMLGQRREQLRRHPLQSGYNKQNKNYRENDYEKHDAAVAGPLVVGE